MKQTFKAKNKRPHRNAMKPFKNFRRISATYTLNEDPQPQVLFTFGFSNLKPAPSRLST
jgi:hypothetical protein